MAKLREAVRACPVSWPRRNRLLEAVGLALWRAIVRGEVSTPEELAQLVRSLRAALWGEELPQDARGLHAWANWRVREFLREVERYRLALLASEELVARIRWEREECKAAWADSAQQRSVDEAIARSRRATKRKLACHLSSSAACSSGALAD